MAAATRASAARAPLLKSAAGVHAQTAPRTTDRQTKPALQDAFPRSGVSVQAVSVQRPGGNPSLGFQA